MLATGINNAQSIYAGALDLDALGVEAETDQILKVTPGAACALLPAAHQPASFVPVNEKAVSQFGSSGPSPASWSATAPTGW